jgi:hypothetical protein
MAIAPTAPARIAEGLFPTPSTPDLGCFVRTVHGFAHDFDFHMWSETSPVLQRRHQVYVRVMCGVAAYHQRCLVYMSTAFVPPGLPPDLLLGGDHPPHPSDWEHFPVQPGGSRQYWFHAEHRNPAEEVWRRDAAVGHSFDLYRNGTLSRVGWDDTGGDRDMDDLVVEVAVVDRSRVLAPFAAAAVDEQDLRTFQADVLPGWERAHRHPRA